MGPASIVDLCRVHAGLEPPHPAATLCRRWAGHHRHRRHPRRRRHGCTAASPTPMETPAAAEVLWDTWGVPHIFADDAPGLFFGFGWAQAHAHGDLLLRLYAQARGRSAEYLRP